MQITQGGNWRDPRIYNGVRYDHEGIDLRAVDSNGFAVAILASAPGIVHHIRNFDPGGGYGKYIVLEHKYGSDTYFTWYTHLSSVDSVLEIGDSVERGERLGVAGSTGNSTGIHLHFGVEHEGNRAEGNFIKGDWVDPKPLLGLI